MSVYRKNIRTQALILTAGIIILAGKFTAWLITDSNAILTDALESIINVVAGAFALYSLFLTAKPKDEDHPYGHGKIEFLSSGFEGGLIFIAGLSMVIKACYNLFHPLTITRLDYGILIIVITGILNYLLGAWLEKQGKKTKSIIMSASGQHLKSDAWSTVGLITGLIVIAVSGILWLDNLVAILLGLFISYTGLRILRKSIAGIMDETDYDVVKEISTKLNKYRHDNWIDIHNLRVIRYGNTYHVDCHLTLPWYFNQREAHAELENIEQFFRSKINARVELFIHVDPCVPECCHYCTIANCPVRQDPFAGKPLWTPQNLIMNKKHYKQ